MRIALSVSELRCEELLEKIRAVEGEKEQLVGQAMALQQERDMMGVKLKEAEEVKRAQIEAVRVMELERTEEKRKHSEKLTLLADQLSDSMFNHSELLRDLRVLEKAKDKLERELNLRNDDCEDLGKNLQVVFLVRLLESWPYPSLLWCPSEYN